jgi:hypothetical protein
VKRAHRSAAESGKLHSGGTRGYGYTRDGVVIPEEKEIVREVARRALDGESWHAIARDLNERGVPTSTRGQWHGSTLANLLRSPRIAGIRKHKGETYLGTWEPLVTIAEHEALVRTKSEPRVFRSPYHLLAGIIYCSECGGKMKTMGFRQKNGKTFERYQCVKTPGRINCGSVAITKKSTDAYVRDDLFRLLSAGSLAPERSSPERDVRRLRKLIAEDRDGLNDLARDRYSRRLIGHDEYVAARAEIDARLGRLEEDRARLEDEQRAAEASKALQPGRLEELLAWWDGADEQERREAVHGAVERVTVRPARRRGGNKFDSDRVRIGYRMSFLSRVGLRVLEDASAEEIAAAEEEYVRLNREAEAS